MKTRILTAAAAAVLSAGVVASAAPAQAARDNGGATITRYGNGPTHAIALRGCVGFQNSAINLGYTIVKPCHQIKSTGSYIYYAVVYR